MGLLRIAAWRSRDYRRSGPRRVSAATYAPGGRPSAADAGRAGQPGRRGIGRRISAFLGRDDDTAGLAAAHLVEPLLVGVVARGDRRGFLLLGGNEFSLARDLGVDRLDLEHERAGHR